MARWWPPSAWLVVVLGAVRGGRPPAVAVAVGGYITAAYWFTSSTSFANPAVTLARTLTDTFAGIAPASVPIFVTMQLLGAALAVPLVRLLFPTAGRPAAANPTVTASAPDLPLPSPARSQP